MSEFKASNGITVVERKTGLLGVELQDEEGENLLDGFNYLSIGELQAVREYLEQDAPDLVAARARWQHQEDARLGRWRWPENPDYVVYPKDTAPQGAWVLSEREPGAIIWHDVKYAEACVGSDVDTEMYARAYLAWVDAHPEPKPWHDAKPGEVWILTLNGCESAWAFVEFSTHQWVSASDPANRISIDNPGITVGRRIWPEAKP